jgi:hypothetical protein
MKKAILLPKRRDWARERWANCFHMDGERTLELRPIKTIVL